MANKKGAGRPKKELGKNPINEQVEELAAMQCTLEEIGGFFGVDKSTISRNYATEIHKGRQRGKISLRRSQFKLAQTNGAVSIWLGRNWLGQSETPMVENDENNGLTEYIKAFQSAVLT